ncbi:PL29 family lyase N-terminal domain-containing protein [Porphyromonadaceae bacterium W3.11]|nr:PL29 family lyase N-terminal domain-containing protein [Porphyromonadaceae bacterium W3.11]
MKKIFYAVLLLPILMISSCTNLDDINQKLDKHEERLKGFELLMSQANEGIISLQQLLDAQAKKLSINSYNPLSDGTGYVLKMSDGSEIVLKNGVDGTTPKIGVTEVDGVLYWSLNNDLILDANGDPIPAKGQDGKDGFTPKIRVSRNGEWEISTDNGVTWEKILDSDGNPVKAAGETEKIDLSITETDDDVIIKYNGKTFIISKKVKAAVTEVKLNYNEYTLRVDQTVSLKATVMPEEAENKKVTWTSDQEKIASVSSSGLVTALSVGTAIITVQPKMEILQTNALLR